MYQCNIYNSTLNILAKMDAMSFLTTILESDDTAILLKGNLFNWVSQAFDYHLVTR